MNQEEIKLLKSRYESLICGLSNGQVSKYDTDFPAIEEAINDAQQQLHYGIIKDDLQKLIDDGGTMLDVQMYVNNL